MSGLDLAIARFVGKPIRWDPMGFGNQSPAGWWVWEDTGPLHKRECLQIGTEYAPSHRWDQGGPIIEKYGVSLDYTGVDWCAQIGGMTAHGDTPLTAAMKIIVATNSNI